jgi:putative endonuclease
VKNYLGPLGETKAVEYLKNNSYKILARNFRSRFGEVDIIAKDKDFLVLVEVKTRSSLSYGRPEEIVNSQKIRSIVRVGQFFQLKYSLFHLSLRVDIIAIEMTKKGELLSLRHFKNITL